MPLAGWPVVDNDIVNYSWLNAIGAVQLYDSTDAGVTFPVASIATPGLPWPTNAYTHLFGIWTARTNSATTVEFVLCRPNGSSSSSYNQALRGAGATVTSAENLASTSLKIGLCAGASSHNAGDFGDGAFFFPGAVLPGSHFAELTAFSFAASNTTTGTGFVENYSGKNQSVGNITSLTFLPNTGSFVAGTRFTVYGL